MINRIKQLMNYEQMSPTNFADAIDINRSSLTHIFSGRNQPSLDVAKKILKAFPEVSTEWLVMGVGPMLKSPTIENEKQMAVTTVDNMQQTDLFADMDNTIQDIGLQGDSANVQANPPKTVIEPSVEHTENSKPVHMSNPDNTSAIAPTPVSSTRTRSRNSDSHISTRESKRERLADSQADKKLVKIVFFYDDRSFEEYRPN